MNKEKFTVLFSNGKTESFHCNSYVEAAVLGFHYCINQAWPMEIKEIMDAEGKKVRQVTTPNYIVTHFEGKQV